MPPSDGVSTLNELNAKYQKWVKNSKTRESGSVGSCNADSSYTSTTVIDGSDPKRVYNYYLCDDDKCIGWGNEQWKDATWGNCLSKSGSADICSNMAVDATSGVSNFDMGDLAGPAESYDPVNNLCVGGPGGFFSSQRGDSTCSISDLAGGVRPAYPNNSSEIDKISDISPVNDTDYLVACPTGFSRKLDCAIDGDGDPGCGFVSPQQNTDYGGDKVRFCARNPTDYVDENVAQCCLGTLGNGPEVDTKGFPISSSYKNCPREFCTTRIDEGTVSGAPGIHCENPGTSKDAGGSQDETFCYEMSKECNQFFTDKCTTDIFSNPQGAGNPLKTYCNHWGHIQPDSFADKAEEICDINNGPHDYVDAPPTATDLTHVKKVLTTPLCRNFITDPDHYAIERPKLQHLCSHYMKPNLTTGVWEKQPLVDNEDHDVLENVCGCHYPNAFYDWWKTTQENRGVGTCEDSAHITQSQLTQETCEAVTGNTWNTDQNAAMLVSSISESMKPFPQCYYLPCSSSMLFDKEDSRNPCKVSIQACVNSITQNNMVFDDDGNIEEYPDMTGHAQQTCNQSQLLAPQTPPTTPDDESSGIGSTISSWLGGGSGTDSGTGSGTGGDSTMIIIIIIVIIIIIIGVVAVVMLNKGNPNPPQQIAQQITQQAPVPA